MAEKLSSPHDARFERSKREAPRDERPEVSPVDQAHRTRRALVICDQWLGSNGYAGMKALRRAGWAVQVIPEWEFVPVRWQSFAMRAAGRLLRPAAVREFNRALVSAARRTRPELLLVFKGTFVRGEALEALRALGVRSYCFYPDVSFRTHGPYLPEALPHYDWVFTTKRFGLRDLHEQLGITRASCILHAYDPDLHRPVPLSSVDLERYGCDVSFIGTWSPKKEAVLRELAERLPRVRLRIWGEQWGRASARGPLRSAIGGHEVAGEEYVRAILASRINLAILSERRAGAGDGDQVTSRTFHIPACGAFMLHERTSELLEIFEEGVSVACYGDGDELASRVEQYLGTADRRDAIARCGHEVVTRAHSWDHRIRAILAVHDQPRP
jgi:spore maturation protein CgeB